MQYHKRNGLQFPRQRKSLFSLSQLIDKNPVPPPQQSISQRMFPNQSLARSKTSQHFYRSMSTFTQPAKTVTSFSHQTRELKSNLLGELRKTWKPKDDNLLKLRSVGTIPKYKSLEIKPRMEEKLPEFDNFKSKQKEKSSQNSSPKDFNPTNQPNKIKFLRKGSSINKQVVANLMKLKMGRQRKELQNSKINNEDIIKMIKLYKGYGQIESEYNLCEVRESRKKMEEKEKKLLNIEKQLDKEIKGWVDNKEEEDFSKRGDFQ